MRFFLLWWLSQIFLLKDHLLEQSSYPLLITLVIADACLPQILPAPPQLPLGLLTQVVQSLKKEMVSVEIVCVTYKVES